MRRLSVTATLLLALAANNGDAQQLPFVVSIVDWQRETLERQRRGYRSDAGEREVLYCVESWTTTALDNGAQRVTITSVRRERSGQTHRIGNVGEHCLAPDGKALPMFHSHSDGNCQLSPSDLITIVARAAPFEGIQCGERHFVWAFAWQVLAVATSVERARLAGSNSQNSRQEKQ